MAPSRKGGSRVAKTNALRNRKLASFLKDFDREGKGRSPGGRGHLGQSRGAGGLGLGHQGFRKPFPRGVTRAVSSLPSRSANAIQANSVRQAEPPQRVG